jgi:peptidoglycan/LPS O-acetylase OafA/YrhL
LRAFAALTVVGVHTAFYSGVTGGTGYGIYTARLEIGVAVFFVISGFLLYRPFTMANLTGGPSVAVRQFWIRRLKRIVPAYWVAFLVITYVLHADTVRHGFGSLAIYLGFAQIYFPNHVISGILQAWSLCTEMSFYLALPLWAIGVSRVARRRPAEQRLAVELAGLGVLVVASFLFRIVILLQGGQMAHAMATWLPANTDLFALGMLLAVLSAWWTVEDRRPALMWHPLLPWISWAMAALTYFVVSNIGLPTIPIADLSVGQALARQTLYGLFALFMVVPAVIGAQDRGLIRRTLQWRPLALLGIVSYGIYLWHESWMNMVMRWTGSKTFGIGFLQLTIPVVVLAVSVAAISYVFVERPIRRLRRKPVNLPRPVLSGLAVER